MSNQLGTTAYLLEEIHRFRKLMGEKSFFKNHDKMDAATDGLAYVYLNTDEINEAATSFFQATLNECNRRESFLLLGV